jgi:hypothetical protein
MQHFPDADEIGPFGPAFLRLMFACAEVDRRVADIQNEVTGDPTFGEQNIWSSVKRPSLIAKLIRKHSKQLKEKPNIRKVSAQLRRAIAPTDLRNVIVHGHWWRFNPETQTLTIRRDKIWPRKKRFVRVTLARIERAEHILTDVDVQLYKSGHALRKEDWALIKEALRPSRARNP